MSFDTLSTAAQKLNMPPATLRSLEERGVVGPFQRDAVGRRLITEADLAAVRRYLDSRRRGARGQEA
jgi:DNA-binding transcriptional MerR regulator